ncbi:MAG: hypothetical protein HQL37_07160 [Alphaproteobacteria bacterium]|nr:hypothetical protein [Alphaproteobacteria bacterium]
MTSADKTAKEQRGKPFAKGKSGNPSGRKAGSRNRATVALEAIIAGEGKSIVQAMIQAALAGDVTAGKALLDRLVPMRKGRPVRIDLPPVQTAADVLAAMGTVVAAVGDGELTPDEGAAVAGLLETKRRAIETIELEMRIAALEQRSWK